MHCEKQLDHLRGEKEEKVEDSKHYRLSFQQLDENAIKVDSALFVVNFYDMYQVYACPLRRKVCGPTFFTAIFDRH